MVWVKWQQILYLNRAGYSMVFLENLATHSKYLEVVLKLYSVLFCSMGPCCATGHFAWNSHFIRRCNNNLGYTYTSGVHSTTTTSNATTMTSTTTPPYFDKCDNLCVGVTDGNVGVCCATVYCNCSNNILLQCVDSAHWSWSIKWSKMPKLGP